MRAPAQACHPAQNNKRRTTSAEQQAQNNKRRAADQACPEDVAEFPRLVGARSVGS